MDCVVLPAVHGSASGSISKDGLTDSTDVPANSPGIADSAAVGFI